MLEKINVRMLDEFSVTADGRVLADSETRMTKPWQLFCYLALNKEHVTPSDVLLQELWGGEKLADPQNVLKNTIYALRRALAGHVKPGETPILYRAGGYCLNGHIKWRIDVDRFLEHCESAAHCRGDLAARTAAWKKAEAGFRGRLLPKLSGEVWVLRAERALIRKYLNCVCELCTGLYETGEYAEVLKASSRAQSIAPLDEKTALWMFRALDRMHMRSEAVIAYNKMSRRFESEMGRPMCEEIRKIYTDAAEAVNKTEQDFAAIREELEEVLEEKGSEAGAFYCNYEVFKRMYAVTAHSAQRSRQSLILMLVTVQGRNEDGMPDEKELTQAMHELRASIAGALRKSDIFAKYSKDQYAVLLTIPAMQTTEGIEQRLRSAYESMRTQDRVQIEIRTAKLSQI